MVTQIMSRTERRMEKKQALLLLILVLAVALVSFALGVMVGRAGGRPSSAENSPSPERLPVAQAPAPVPGEPTAPTTPAADHLTFYDALPKGEQPPLGSGINLPPEEAAPKAPAAAEKPAAPTVARTDSAAGNSTAARQNSEERKTLSPPGGAVQATAPSTKPAESAKTGGVPTPAKVAKAAPATPPAAKPVSAAAGGSFVIQVASYPDEGGARKLRDRLAARGFGAYIEVADLGSKGKWHRVIVGSYESDQAAAAAASRLKAEEKVSGMVRRK